MRKKPEIIQRHLTGNTNRQIARDIGLNRKTVDKYVREWREAQAAAVRETGAPLREPSSTLDTATQFCDHRIADSLIEVPDESPLVATTSALESHMLAVKMAPAAIGSRRGKRRIIQPWRGSRGIGTVVFTPRSSSVPGTGTVKVSTRTGDTAS